MNTTSTTLTLNQILTQLEAVRQKGSFEDDYYPILDSMIATIGQLKRSGEISDEGIKEIQQYFGQDFLENTLHGMALLKKYGYAGDFLMIDKIYTGNTPQNPFFKSWDNYFQNHAAPKAVRNRKEYFKTLVQHKLNKNPSMKLLNVASGPGRDLLELYTERVNGYNLETTCVEMDPHAIGYAQNLVNGFGTKINFINKNIFKFDTTDKYDLIWSAGLFDYFDNKAFVFVLKKFKTWIKNKGEIVVGNFNQAHNPTREYMELFGDWYLHHRTADELISLAIEAGFNETQLIIKNEEEKVNLFLHIDCSEL